jgi:hypothetical protein
MGHDPDRDPGGQAAHAALMQVNRTSVGHLLILRSGPASGDGASRLCAH